MSFSDNIDSVKKFIQDTKAEGGADEPEDLQGGLKLALLQDWTEEATKRVFIIFLSTASIVMDWVASRKNVTLMRAPISSNIGSIRPPFSQALIILRMPLPHCSINPSSKKVRAITGFLSLDIPCLMSSMVKLQGKHPLFSISILLENMAI